jgi:cytochrome c556
MLRTFFAAGLLALGVTAALAQTDVVKERQALMKQNGQATRTVAGMLRGQAPFNLEQVQAALKAYQNTAEKFASLFPKNSRTGDTAALPVVWEQKADFTARDAKFGRDAAAALAAIKDEATFKAEMPKVLQNCQGCHDTYRKPNT